MIYRTGESTIAWVRSRGGSFHPPPSAARGESPNRRAASAGTLFLDEIGTVPLHLRGQLLTALERREVAPVGADRPEPIDVQICATNVPPERLADENVLEAAKPALTMRVRAVSSLLRQLRISLP